MDNDKFHNANILGNNLRLEKKIFQKEIDKLNLEKEVMRLGFEKRKFEEGSRITET